MFWKRVSAETFSLVSQRNVFNEVPWSLPKILWWKRFSSTQSRNGRRYLLCSSIAVGVAAGWRVFTKDSEHRLRVVATAFRFLETSPNEPRLARNACRPFPLEEHRRGSTDSPLVIWASDHLTLSWSNCSWGKHCFKSFVLISFGFLWAI